jgi:2-polyprenyl-6-hydroxyphenyl methylase/3-demethylubiquinone-9 3-methyltransferase
MDPTLAMHAYWDHGEKPPGSRLYLWPPVMRRLASLPKGSAILDAGCGNGWLAKTLADQGFEVCGIDLQESGIDHARRLDPRCRFALASVYDDYEPLFERQFDAVVSLEVIEHLYDPSAFVKRVFQALRPGGLFVLTTPYHGWLKNVLVAVGGKHDQHFNPLGCGGHIKFWSPATLGKLLADHQFQVLGYEGAGRLPYLWKSMVFAARR